MHDTALISTIALSLVFAFIGGFAAHKLRLSPIVGYLVVGILIGPHTPGLVADTELARQLSEIGVILLMFGVGMHFSTEDLLAVRRIAIPGAILQIVVATTLGALLAVSWGWSMAAALFFGLALSVASTVVLIKALESRQSLGSADGKIAVGWLIVEDLVTVLALVLLPALAPLLTDTVAATTASSHQLLISIGSTLAKVTAFILIMVFIGKRLCPWLLAQVAASGSRELFTLFVIGSALGIAFFSAQLFNVSMALGAFFAGVVMRESELSHRAAAKALPFQDAFAVLFFVSVGMLFDPKVIFSHPVELALVLAIILGAKTIAAFVLILLFRYPLHSALTIAASLAQIGEFSFILAALGLHLGVLPQHAYSLILGGAIISISLNPLVFRVVDLADRALNRLPLIRNFDSKNSASMASQTREIATKGHVVLVGFGRSGRRIGRMLQSQNVPFVVIEQDRELVVSLRAQGIPAVYGDAEVPDVLREAAVDTSRLLIITATNPFDTRQICDHADDLNSQIRIIARTNSEEEQEYLESLPRVELVVLAERELARAINVHVVRYYVPHSEQV